MKKLFSAVVSAIVLMAFNSPAVPIPAIRGVLTVNWSLLQQAFLSNPKYPGLGKTNVTGTGAAKATNVMQINKDTFTKTPFNSASLIALLGHSMATSFSTGSKLVLAGNIVYVADSTGANGTDVSSILRVTTSDMVLSGMNTQIRTTRGSNTTETTSGTGSGNQIVILTYDDTANPPTDQFVSKFTFVGASAFSESDASMISSTDQLTEKTSETFALKGVGYGSIRTVPSNIQGSITGTISGTETINLGLPRG